MWRESATRRQSGTSRRYRSRRIHRSSIQVTVAMSVKSEAMLNARWNSKGAASLQEVMVYQTQSECSWAILRQRTREIALAITVDLTASLIWVATAILHKANRISLRVARPTDTSRQGSYSLYSLRHYKFSIWTHSSKNKSSSASIAHR